MTQMAPNDRVIASAANELMLVVAAFEAADDLLPNASEMIDKHDNLISLLENTRPDTEAGLVAKAAALLAEGPQGTVPSLQERLAISLATDVLRTFGGKVLPIIPTSPCALSDAVGAS